MNPKSNFLTNSNTQLLFKQFNSQFENILQLKAKFHFNSDLEDANVIYTSQQDSSILNLWIHNPASKYVQNTSIPRDRLLVKISYLEVNPKSQGLGSQLFQTLVSTLRTTPIKRIIVIPESEAALNFWLRQQFIPWNGDQYRLYLDI
ncbi:TPA: N-acetyltransferase [Bacillus cereus]|uniref:N-acetyltransferase n=1 Tax=Bacillus TaxID=1386 RepID=UPI0001A15B8D|nr:MULTISPECIES: N-acetyltransferase [Bacillus]EEL90547.1 hypothetical protein bcere0030_55050 [Bacillus cereus AH1273]MED2680652.1 N-acetyltransferase [Bacillus thuringiensis]EKS7862055.1 N-acetyltransferase [Bacillus cereus]MBL3742288.1 N-acetyltransferase [Bacillus cereus]MBL3864968.1 N-acetyltransferase [Bacillus cereus]